MSIKAAAFAGAFVAASVAAQSVPSVGDAESVVVTGTPTTEETLIGENQQPEWTAHRRFSTTRIYVLPPWQIEFEQWWKGKFPREGEPDNLFQSEIEIGLPWRFQLDVYENVENADSAITTSNQIEARWALAEWGKIFLNPTLYAEWKFNNSAADAYELKLLFGEQLAPRWHWGFNLFYEQETGGVRATEMGFSQAVSYSAIDSKLSVGVEMNFERTTEKGSRSNPEIEFLIGPSIQWRPTRRIHVDFVPLFGATHDSPVVESYIVFGFELWGGAERTDIQAPTSTRAR
jgi:hypothetical protein